MRRDELNNLGEVIHEWASKKGFYDHEYLTTGDLATKNPSLPAEKLALIHSEVSEMLEALRDDDWNKEQEECADLIIRTLDYASWRGFDVDKAIADKMKINDLRPHLHGRSF